MFTVLTNHFVYVLVSQSDSLVWGNLILFLNVFCIQFDFLSSIVSLVRLRSVDRRRKAFIKLKYKQIQTDCSKHTLFSLHIAVPSNYLIVWCCTTWHYLHLTVKQTNRKVSKKSRKNTVYSWVTAHISTSTKRLVIQGYVSGKLRLLLR